MFIWNLEKCLKIFTHVYVSSDSYDILQLAAHHGAIAIHRDDSLCGDVPDIPVYQHALAKMENVGGIVAVHANNPTIDANLIAVVKKFLEMGVPEVMTCYPMTKNKDYKKQANKIYGSIRGIRIDRLQTYPNPYHPNPEILIIDTSLEIETIEDFNKLND